MIVYAAAKCKQRVSTCAWGHASEGSDQNVDKQHHINVAWRASSLAKELWSKTSSSAGEGRGGGCRERSRKEMSEEGGWKNGELGRF